MEISFRVEIPRLSSVAILEAAFRRCSIKKFTKFCKIHRKMPVLESLFDAIFSTY